MHCGAGQASGAAVRRVREPPDGFLPAGEPASPPPEYGGVDVVALFAGALRAETLRATAGSCPIGVAAGSAAAFLAGAFLAGAFLAGASAVGASAVGAFLAVGAFFTAFPARAR